MDNYIINLDTLIGQQILFIPESKESELDNSNLTSALIWTAMKQSCQKRLIVKKKKNQY